MTKKQRRIAEELAALFQWYLVQRTLNTGVSVAALWKSQTWKRATYSFNMLSLTEQRAFKRAAIAVIMMQADPREYITAQFQAYETYTNQLGRTVLPTAGVLSTLGSQARYAMYKQKQNERKNRDAVTVEKMVTRDHYREERKLASLSKMLRIPQEDVLTQQPEEFTRDFLKAKCVWPVVKELYKERTT